MAKELEVSEEFLRKIALEDECGFVSAGRMRALSEDPLTALAASYATAAKTSLRPKKEETPLRKVS